MKFDQYEDTSDEESSGESDDDKGRMTNLRFYENEHPEAWSAFKGGGPIRSFFSDKDDSVHDFMSEVILGLEELCSEGDRLPLMEFIVVSPADILRYVDERDWGSIERNDGEVVITLPLGDEDDSDDDSED